jgi:hypothetical protein
MLLENNGYEVLEATGGEEGLKLFCSHSVDAVVLDYQRWPAWLERQRCPASGTGQAKATDQ